MPVKGYERAEGGSDASRLPRLTMMWVTFGSSVTFQLSVTDACPGVAVAPVIPGETVSLEAVANDEASTPTAVMPATSRTHARAPMVSARHRARTSFCSILTPWEAGPARLQTLARLV